MATRSLSTSQRGRTVTGKVWRPQLHTGLMRYNRVRACLGHYPASGFDAPVPAPKRDATLGRSGGAVGWTLEVQDGTSYGVAGSRWLPAVLARGLPHPMRFREVWSLPIGLQPLFVWEGVPPTPEFVCLGMVTTNSPEPPSVACVRCVPKRWVVTNPELPYMMWENAGTGGRHGSLWMSGRLGLLLAVPGTNAPRYQQEFDMNITKFQQSDLLPLPKEVPRVTCLP
eukprot:gene19349-23135_t